jgi:hypothetical protein
VKRKNNSTQFIKGVVHAFNRAHYVVCELRYTRSCNECIPLEYKLITSNFLLLQQKLQQQQQQQCGDHTSICIGVINSTANFGS